VPTSIENWQASVAIPKDKREVRYIAPSLVQGIPSKPDDDNRHSNCNDHQERRPGNHGEGFSVWFSEKGPR
jgi:hypothetical protein